MGCLSLLTAVVSGRQQWPTTRVVGEYLTNLLIFKAPGGGRRIDLISIFTGSFDPDAGDYHGDQGDDHGHRARAQEAPDQGARRQDKAFYSVFSCHHWMTRIMTKSIFKAKR